MGQTLTIFNLRIGSFAFLCSLVAAFGLLPTFSSAQVTVTTNSTNVTCSGFSNGMAEAFPGGGWDPYTYQWSNGATTKKITNLTPGVYTVTATDKDLGSATATAIISQPEPLGVYVEVNMHQICASSPEGKVSANPGGGTVPYTYLWNTGPTTPSISGLAAGTYTITVTDANGCTVSGSATVIDYTAEGIWVQHITMNVTCFGFNNGMAEAMPMSGTPPYTFQWAHGPTTKKISNLAPGTYSVVVSDASGCIALHNVTITEPPALTASATTTNALCGLSGTAQVTASGGTAPYSVLWSTGATTLTITVPAGTYTVTVTDANACAISATATVSVSGNALNVNATPQSNAGCTIGGSAQATANGGSGNYAYVWDNGQMNATANNLSAGIHKFTVTDVTTGCMGTGSVTIPAAPLLTAAANLQTNATCTVGGSAQAVGTGGTPPYTYKWDNGQLTQAATNLGAGPHNVTVTDSKGCVAVAAVSIGQSQGPSVTAAPLTSATCTAGGSAQATASAGSSPYTYLWDNNQTTVIATNLTPGVHKVTVTDANGCSAMASVTITQPGAPSLTLASSTTAGCTTPASAAVAGTGGTSPYTYQWSNNATGTTQTSLSAGSYTVTVTDAAGCTATLQVSIAGTLPPAVVISASSNAKCGQPGSATASVSGGTGPFTYKWDNNETTAVAVNLNAGPHTVTVTAADGCTATASVTIGFANDGIKIGDYVWFDNDQDGFQNPLEVSGVPNVKVMLIQAGPDGIFGNGDDVTVGMVTTDAAGKYQFTCVVPGSYVIMFSGIPSGYQFTQKDFVPNDCKDSDAGTNGKTASFTIMPGAADNPCFDAGIHIKCENVLNAGIICCNHTICEGETPAAITGVLPVTGGTGPIQYQWLQLVAIGQSPPQWVGITGATSASYQPGPLHATAYYMRCARREGCISFLETNIVTITVLPAGSPGCGSFIQSIVASPQGLTSVAVSWTTQPENDQYMYTVEHSEDKITWEKVTNVMGQHKTNSPNSYSIIDQTPLNGENFYRIKRENANGTLAFSQVVVLSLDISTERAVVITPNPVNTTLNIRNVLVFESEIEIQIVNMNGAVLNTLIIPAGSLEFIELPVGDLPTGIYFARVRLGDQQLKTVRITKL